ncbi:MAG: NAD(P)/FAD-dependent oxidoreductase [Planctomycetota bacterium]
METGEPAAIWRLRSLEVAVGEPEAAIRERACRELAIDPERLRSFRIARKSLDARRRGGEHRLKFVLHVDLAVDRSFRSSALSRAKKTGRVVPAPEPYDPRVERVHPTLAGAPRIVIVGAGPAGLFAAWILARHGLAVTVLDRGSRVDRRSRELVRFHRTRIPDPESNLLFGEGGAGTYSDGKVYTRVDDPLEVPILEALVSAGAPAALLYDGRAHIGTDRLHRLLPVLRSKLEEQGARFLWNTRLEGFDARVRVLETSAGPMPCDALFLAVGHSARDTWATLARLGVPFQAKPFQVGVRIEHPQELVDRAQHGAGPEARALGAAYYQLVSRAEGEVAASHSFCMCPGGRIVASVNEPGLLCTNGMSNSTHSTRYANAAIVATVEPGGDPFAGVVLQRDLERRFFEAGGKDYTAPAQRADDFLEGRPSQRLPGSSFTFGSVPARIDELLPPHLRDALRAAIARFDRSIEGFAGEQGILVGVETRSACPVRIPRDRTTRRAEGFAHLYPVGEGAGYAGGIMSAAIDGARSALALLEHGI